MPLQLLCSADSPCLAEGGTAARCICAHETPPDLQGRQLLSFHAKEASWQLPEQRSLPWASPHRVCPNALFCIPEMHSLRFRSDVHAFVGEGEGGKGYASVHNHDSADDLLRLGNFETVSRFCSSVHFRRGSASNECNDCVQDKSRRATNKALKHLLIYAACMQIPYRAVIWP